MATHKIVHIEIPATSGKESAEFYCTLFDWPVDVDPNFDYWMFNPSEGPVGGFSMMTEGGPIPTKPGDVLVYVTTDDIEATLARAESLGGKALVHTTEIPGTG